MCVCVCGCVEILDLEQMFVDGFRTIGLLDQNEIKFAYSENLGTLHPLASNQRWRRKRSFLARRLHEKGWIS